MNEKTAEMKKKYEGCLVGLSVGDALGAPVEFLTRKDIIKSHGRVTDYVKALSGHSFSNFNPGQYTDDAQLAIAMAQSLVNQKKFDYQDFASNLIEWYKKGDFRAAGKATRAACKNLIRGKALESGISDACGTGAATRAAPLGLIYNGLGQDSGRSLVSDCIYSSILTHRDQRAFASAAAVARSVNYVKQLNGYLDVQHFLKCVSDFTGYTETVNTKGVPENNGETLESKLKSLNHLRGESFEKAMKKIGYGGHVFECVPSAILAFVKSPDDFERTIVSAVNSGGDSDSRAAIAGAISGAYNGIEKIPRRFLDNLENKDLIISLSDKLFEIFSQ